MLWPNEADEILSLVQADKASEPMSLPLQFGYELHSRWNDPVEDYPHDMLAVLKMMTRVKAVEYLKAKAPKHIALMMLASEAQ